MAERREIDERDIDKLLSALTDRQIANVFGWSEIEVSRLRLTRRNRLFPLDKKNQNDRNDRFGR
jgi:hypothetical protein